MTRGTDDLKTPDLKTIKVAEDLSRFPGGRYKKDGPNSGESLREMVAVSLRSNKGVTLVDFRGTAGVPASFAEEAFGGLIREEDFSLEELNNRLAVDADLAETGAKIWQYMEEAAEVKANKAAGEIMVTLFDRVQLLSDKMKDLCRLVGQVARFGGPTFKDELNAIMKDLEPSTEPLRGNYEAFVDETTGETLYRLRKD